MLLSQWALKYCISPIQNESPIGENIGRFKKSYFVCPLTENNLDMFSWTTASKMSLEKSIHFAPNLSLRFETPLVRFPFVPPTTLIQNSRLRF